jgi:hypothetical protein
MLETNLQIRAVEFCTKKGLRFDERARLGDGTDGRVWEVAGESGGQSALKVFERSKNYHNELQCYQILQRNGVVSICGFNVPELVDFDDDLLALQMTIVQPPYILDFGKVIVITRRTTLQRSGQTTRNHSKRNSRATTKPLRWLLPASDDTKSTTSMLRLETLTAKACVQSRY